MSEMEFLELVIVILLVFNAILSNKVTNLNNKLNSIIDQTEVFLNDLGNRVKTIEKENKNKWENLK